MSRKRRGDCYAAAGRLLLDWRFTDIEQAHQEGRKVFLVHAEVFHPKVGWHGHGWVERDDDLAATVDYRIGIPVPGAARVRNVYDFASKRQTILPAELYYILGNVRNPQYYTPEEAFKLMVETGHFGPWD